MFPKIPRLDNTLFLTIASLSIIFILVLLYDSSPVSYNSYVTICTSNYGEVFQFTDCMKPYYNQLFADRIGIFAAGFVLISSTVIFLAQRLKKSR